MTIRDQDREYLIKAAKQHGDAYLYSYLNDATEVEQYVEWYVQKCEESGDKPAYWPSLTWPTMEWFLIETNKGRRVGR